VASAVNVQVGGALERRDDAKRESSAHRRLLARAARAALRYERVTDAEISLTLLDDAEITDLNRQFLSRDEPTDVIAFALYEPPEPPVGDVYIGFDQAVRQAAVAGVAIGEELTRLAIHGVLHVLGHDHPDGPERTDTEMWRIQEDLVARVTAV
jgi:probable rRNA maturation factor